MRIMSAADLPALPLDTSAYLSDTGHLKTIEHGAYLLILMAMWRSKDGWLPASDHYLARATRMTLGRWKRIAPAIRALLVTQGEKVSQKRVQRDRRNQYVTPSKEIPTGNPIRGAKSLKNIDPIPKTGETPKIPTTTLFEEGSVTSVVKKENKKGSGHRLPDDWRPREAERLYARTVLRMPDAEIDRRAERLRRWALSNAHRKVALKSDWDMTFRNWLDDKQGYDQQHTGPARRPSSNGHASNLARLFEQQMNGGDHDDANLDDQRALSAGVPR